ncbi:NADH-quinone oxidoreductase subunit M [Janibacter sp. Y6]|uniref:complex I subunit 4 family protein n=1 Tax=Janibacter TaxID=53457 RepID=UPI0020956D0C|nr:NADH-quinone oxidoreductase subunit M [Janibacter melonis]
MSLVLALALALPVVAAVALIGGAGRGRSAQVVVVTSLVSLVLLVVAWAGGGAVDLPWLPALGLRLALAVDGLSGPLMALTLLVTALAALVHRSRPADAGDGSEGQEASEGTFAACLLLTAAAALLTFTARDAILFVVGLECVLVPMWVLITRYGDPRSRREAGWLFVLATGLGSVVLLLGVLLLVRLSGTSDLETLAATAGSGLTSGQQLLVAGLLTAGLAIKVPVWPLHSWLPVAHSSAPTAGSMLLAAVLLKLGTYGLIRLPLASVPDGFAQIAPVLGVLGVVGILWGGLVCLVELELKRLVAWSSVAHMGFVVLALSTGTRTGVVAAVLGNLAHGVVSALLFAVVGVLRSGWGSGLLRDRAALRDTHPRLGVLLLVGLAAGAGLPGLAPFWGELGALVSAWQPATDRPQAAYDVLAVLAAAGAALGGAYAVRVVRAVWLGDASHGASATGSDPEGAGVVVPRADLLVLVVLAVLTVVLGVAPGVVTSLTTPVLDALPGVVR